MTAWKPVSSRRCLKPTNVILPVEKDDLGNGMRHQATREFSVCCPNALGISISQDAHISLYRQGKLISRLYQPEFCSCLGFVAT